MEGALVLIRPPEVIAAEINHLKRQTEITVLNNAIEIGRRLVEAKQRVPHGEWGGWLETAVEFKQSTANNLMRIFEEYGSEQLSLFVEENAKSQTLGNLTYSKAVALLAVPADEREDFVKENDIEAKSTRELQKIIRERDKAQKSLAAAQSAYEQARADYADIKETLGNEREEATRKITELSSSITNLNKKLEAALATDNQKDVESLRLDLAEADGLLKAANDEIEELNKKLAAKPIDVPATQIVEKSSDAIKVLALADTFGKNFELILEALEKLPEEEERIKYQKGITALLNTMIERL